MRFGWMEFDKGRQSHFARDGPPRRCTATTHGVFAIGELPRVSAHGFLRRPPLAAMMRSVLSAECSILSTQWSCTGQRFAIAALMFSTSFNGAWQAKFSQT